MGRRRARRGRGGGGGGLVPPQSQTVEMLHVTVGPVFGWGGSGRVGQGKNHMRFTSALGADGRAVARRHG